MNNTQALTQLRFFDPEERVANATAIAESALRDLLPLNLPHYELLRRAEWLAWLRYPGDLENNARITDALNNKMSDVDCVMSLNVNADMPCFDTISRAIRKAYERIRSKAMTCNYLQGSSYGENIG